MPSIEHETIVDMFRRRPRLAGELVTEALGHALPPHAEVAVAETDFTEITPVPYRADLALLLRSRKRAVHALVVEVQLSVTGDKLFTWPHYAVAGRLLWRCEVTVVVVTPYAKVARWAAKRRPIGGGNTFAPLVVGPEQIPEVVDVDEAVARPELAVLSAMAHGRREVGGRIALAAAEAARRLDPDTAALYYDVVLGSLGPAAQRALEALMPNGRYEYKSEFARKYFAEGLEKGREEGLADGERRTLLKLLRLKFQHLPPTIVARVEAAEIADLDRWAERILAATTLDDVFAE
jgi:hypothetical protein